MSPRKRTNITSRRGSTGAMLLCLFGAAGTGRAQNVLMAPTQNYSVTPPAVQTQLDQGMGALPKQGETPSLTELMDPLHWGPVTVHPHVSYQLLYEEGIQSAPGQPQNSLVQTVSSGVLFNIGTHWTLDYNPSLTYYSNNQFHDSFSQSATLAWGTYYEDWSFSFSQGYSSSDSPSVQTGTQTSSQSYSTSADASYRFNSVMSVDMGVSQSISSAEQFTSSSTWNTMEWLNYQFWPRLDGSIGAGFGYDDVNPGPNMSHETAQLRLSWRVANKTSLVVHGGVEDRQYLGGGIPDSINPVYGVTLQYHPFVHTAISLDAERAVTASLFAGQATESSSLNVSLNQRLFKHFSLNVAGSYGVSDYVATTSTVVTGRSDTYYTVSAGLGWSFLKRATASLSYQYSVNSSSATGFGFTSSQYGLQLGYAF